MPNFETISIILVKFEKLKMKGFQPFKFGDVSNPHSYETTLWGGVNVSLINSKIFKSSGLSKGNLPRIDEREVVTEVEIKMIFSQFSIFQVHGCSISSSFIFFSKTAH